MLLMFIFHIEIDDLCSADEALCYFQGDFDSLYGYERNHLNSEFLFSPSISYSFCLLVQ